MKQPDKSLPTLVSELWQLVVAYVKQETIEPIKGLGRFIGFGLAGSVLLAIGVPMLALAGLRALQAETGGALDDRWSWVPHAIVMVVLLVVAAVLARAISKGKVTK